MQCPNCQHEFTPVVPSGLVMNGDKHEVRQDGELVELTRIEWELLWQFVNHPSAMVVNEYLAELIFGYTDQQALNLVKWHISNLRKKLGWDTSGPLVTVRGYGYRYDGEGS
jgi:DNA-binding response OmpR family regulator